MSLDGAGTYSPPAPEFPAVSGTTILASDFNAIIQDIAAALSQAIFRDGQAAFTADQSLGGWKLRNLANGVLAQDATTVLQVFTDPTFTGTDTAGVGVGGTALTVTVTLANFSGATEVSLPSNSHGVTQPTTDASTKLATMEAVQSVAMNAALPAQSSSTTRKVPRSDGTSAAWGEVIPPFVSSTYRQYEVVLSQVDFLPYQKITAAASHSTDPKSDKTNWRCLASDLQTADVTGTSQTAADGYSYVLLNASTTAVTAPTAADGVMFEVVPANGLFTNTVAFGSDTVRGPTGTATGTITLDLGVSFKVRYNSTISQWVML